MKIRMILREDEELPIFTKIVTSLEDLRKIQYSGTWNKTELGNSLYCKNAGIKKFTDMPLKVDGAFICNNNGLTNLIGGPKEINGSYDCSHNRLKSLDGVPKEIKGFFDCSVNRLTSLEGIHKQINSIHDTFYVGQNQIVSHVLGLLLIKKLKLIDGLSVVSTILNRHIQNDKDVLECQEELISAGYKEFAKL